MSAAGSKAALIGGIGTGDLCRGGCDGGVARRSPWPGFWCARSRPANSHGALFLVGIRRSVRLADRRLHHAQPAAQLYVRSAAARRCCRSCPQSSDNRNVTSRSAAAHGIVLALFPAIRRGHAVTDRSARLPTEAEIAAINAQHLIEHAAQARRSAVRVRHPRGCRASASMRPAGCGARAIFAGRSSAAA